MTVQMNRVIWFLISIGLVAALLVASALVAGAAIP